MKNDWEVKPLGDVCDVVNGGTPKTGVSDYWDGTHLWVTPAEMGRRSSPFIGDTARKLSDAGLRNSSAQLMPPYSVILSSRAPIGHLVINTEPMATNQGCKGLVPRENLFYKYLFYFLRHNVELLNALGTGATFKELSGGKLKEVAIPIPPLAEQKRIVTILDEAFEAIDKPKQNAEKNLQNARELFESYLQNIFANPAPDWRMTPLGQLTKLSRGQNPPKSKFISRPKTGYVRFYQIRDGWSDEYAVYVPDNSQLHKVLPEDILMVAYRHIGRAFRGVTGAFNVALCKITNVRKDKLDDDFLFQLIPTSFVKGELMKRSERSLIPSMSVEHLKDITIPLPSLDDQREIMLRFDELKAETTKLEAIYGKKLDDFDELKKSILQKAFSGEL